MQLVMNSRRLELTTHLQSYIAKKVSKLEKHVPALGQVRTELTEYETHPALERYTCQMNYRTCVIQQVPEPREKTNDHKSTKKRELKRNNKLSFWPHLIKKTS